MSEIIKLIVVVLTFLCIDIIRPSLWEIGVQGYQHFEEDNDIFVESPLTQPDPSIPGDLGSPLLSGEISNKDKNMIERQYQVYGYNKFISDQIPHNRRLKDQRADWCNLFTKKLLSTSVIMCFHNEATSVLLRSVHSILERSPDHLLTEILLIDDNSDIGELRELELHLTHLSKVRLVRLPKREGVARCRMIGANKAVSPILTFVDSHIEVTVGWLQPLLDPIAKNSQSITSPILDKINPETFAYEIVSEDVEFVGGFDWNLSFKWRPVTERELAESLHPGEPVLSPVVHGAVFSIHAEFFNRLSRFDSNYEFWGGENLELSFKSWMCGGKVIISPCSHVAHLQRVGSPYPKERVLANLGRLATVWLDEYGKYFFEKNPTALEFGDVSERLKVKDELRCSSFNWYLQNIVPDMLNPKNVLARGAVKNLGFDEVLCLDAFHSANKSDLESSLYWDCHSLGGNQFWYYTVKGEIRKDDSCLDHYAYGVSIYECHGLRGNQQWEYHPDTGVITLTANAFSCLTLDEAIGKVILAPCQGGLNQRWKFQFEHYLFEQMKTYKYSKQKNTEL